jgi:hypothetical protein
MRHGAGNPDRLQTIFFVDRVREAGGVGRHRIDGLVAEFDSHRGCIGLADGGGSIGPSEIATD